MKQVSDSLIIEQLKLINIDQPVRVLYSQYYNSVVSQVAKNGGSSEDGSDIFQDAVLILIDKIKKDEFRQESTIKTFLFSVGKNLWLQELRARSRRTNRELKYSENEINENFQSHKWLGKESKHSLLETIEKVGNTCQKILYGFYFEEKSMKELLEQFNFKNDQVLRNQKAKCMKKLKELINGNPLLKIELRYSNENE